MKNCLWSAAVFIMAFSLICLGAHCAYVYAQEDGIGNDDMAVLDESTSGGYGTYDSGYTDTYDSGYDMLYDSYDVGYDNSGDIYDGGTFSSTENSSLGADNIGTGAYLTPSQTIDSNSASGMDREEEVHNSYLTARQDAIKRDIEAFNQEDPSGQMAQTYKLLTDQGVDADEAYVTVRPDSDKEQFKADTEQVDNLSIKRLNEIDNSGGAAQTYQYMRDRRIAPEEAYYQAYQGFKENEE